GTWIFKFLLPASRYDTMGGWTHLRFCFVNAEEDMPPFWYTRSQDSHNYTGVGHENRIDHDIGWAPVRKLWQEVRIIRTKDGGLYTWADGVFQFRGRELRGKESASMSIKLAHFRPDRDPTGVMCIDMVEVYRDKYLFGPKSIRFGQYIHDWTWGTRGQVQLERWFDFDHTPTLFRVPPKPVAIGLSREYLKKRWRNRVYLPTLKEGIVVDGRGVRLRDIAARVRNKSLFRYDRKTKTAVCGTNLVINEAAELIMDGETLKFDCKTPGQHEFVVMFGSTLNVKNSTITTTNENHFNWRLDGMTHFGYRCGPIHNPLHTGPSHISNLWYHGMCSLFLHGSTIDNFAYMFISSPMQVDITDTKFTNIHEVDTAEYEKLYGRKDYPGGAARGIRSRFKGNKGFWLGLFGDKTNGFNIRGVYLRRKRSLSSMVPQTPPLNLTFFANDDDYESFNVYDIKAPEENIVVRKGYRIRGYAKPVEAESTVGLVNAKFAKIVVPTDKARAVVKYYLKVNVTDASGKTIPDAKITVITEADNKAYPPVNEDGTWIVADYVQDKAGKKDFTYTVEVTTSDGRKASIKGVNPDASWYRADGRKNAMTIRVPPNERKK
ncbi:MAG: carboxypeptidase regulatory-like domain-containing protein, partial [Phycisphaerae bacterium]|nr:carboxypeptidase regulatory-like domain-containing protein [Phycisphaerae bacterium]